jgi:hypothetical protein
LIFALEVNMGIVQVAGIVFAAAVIVILAYLYRESAIIEGKTEVGIGPIKFSLGGRAQKKAEAELPEGPAAPVPTESEPEENADDMEANYDRAES